MSKLEITQLQQFGQEMKSTFGIVKKAEKDKPPFSVVNYSLEMGHDESSYYARLFSNSPELLEELEKLVNHTRRHLTSSSDKNPDEIMDILETPVYLINKIGQP